MKKIKYKHLNHFLRHRLFILVFLVIQFNCFFADANDGLQAREAFESAQGDNGDISPSPEAERPKRDVYFKTDQGFSYNRLLDQRMSNLHYQGTGGVLSFGRYVETPNFVSEIGFLRLTFYMALPHHKESVVTAPAIGMKYMHLRKIHNSGPLNLRLGAQLDALANMRLAPMLSNSFLYVDLIAEISPRIDIGYALMLFKREWNFDFSFATSMLGYGLRIPEYGASYQLGTDGSETLANSVSMLLHPGNYNHFVTGIFYKNSFGRAENPNRFRIGYVWDFYTIRGAHDLKTFNAGHQLVLELYFLVN